MAGDDVMTGPGDGPITLDECVMALECRVHGSYADCTEVVDDLLDIGFADALDREPCRPPALAWAEAFALVLQALALAGRGRGCGDADDEPHPRPRVPAGGGGEWGD